MTCSSYNSFPLFTVAKRDSWGLPVVLFGPKYKVICFLQEIPKRRLKNFIANISILLVVSAIGVQLYGQHRGHVELHLSWKSDVFFLFQILLSFTIADVAIAILVWISVIERPSLLWLMSMYINAPTSSCCSTFKNI